MIVLSVGMPRAGSGWHYNLIHDLMKKAGSIDSREIREQFHLQRILTEVNCNIGVLSLRRLAMVTVPALLGKTFVIKAHAGPTTWSRLLQRLNLLRITYIYRDPRDTMLSAYEYGQRALTKGRPNAFSHLSNFEKTLAFMEDYVRIWEDWQTEKNVLSVRYEDLLNKYNDEAARLVTFLQLDGSSPEVQTVVENYRPSVAKGQQGLHFYKGKTGRFHEFYSKQEQAVMIEHFGTQIQRMGYPTYEQN